MPDNENKELMSDAEVKRKLILSTAILAVLMFLSVFVFPADAYAAGNAVNFTSIISSLKQLVSVVLLPIGIVIVGWRIAYLGIFCAMAGIDPLNIMGKEGKGVTTSEAVAEIKKHLGDFIHGVLWVGGIWIVFQLALTVAQIFASSLAALT